MRQRLLLGSIIVVLIAAACNSTAPSNPSADPANNSAAVSTPTEVLEAAQAAWEHYKWSEKNYGVVRGGGWHLDPAEAAIPFEMVQAEKGTTPNELRALMAGSNKGYKTDVWCVSFKPPLYFGTTPEDGKNIRMDNMFFFQGRDGDWHELCYK